MNKKEIDYKGKLLCFWSWNNKLDNQELNLQIEDFANGKFDGVIIHSRAGLKTAYLSEEWFKHYEFVLKKASELDLDVWIYDEDGWPSGFAGGIVPQLGTEYQRKTFYFTNEKNDVDYLLAVWKKSNGKMCRVDNECGDGDLYCYYFIDKNYVDLLNPNVVTAFINSTHEKYKYHFKEYFGNTIQGVFTDEPQVSIQPWSEYLASAWGNKYGSNILDELYLLTEDSDEAKAFSQKFRSLINEQINVSFTAQIAKWCEDNNILFTGHFSKEDGLCGQTEDNGGVMNQYISMQLPGIDHLGNRITSPVLSKQLSSIHRQFGKKGALSETFGGAGWGVTFEELSWMWGYQAALGVTVPCLHLSAYSIMGRRKRDYPAFFSYQTPWWKDFGIFNKWINGLNNLMQQGERIVDTLVISPLESIKMLNSCQNGEKERISAQYRLLLENLLNLQLDFELTDEYILENFSYINDSSLTIGKCSYKNIIASECLTLSENTIKLLSAFVDAGGKVLFVGKKPEINVDNEKLLNACVAQNRVDILERCIQYLSIARPVTIVDINSNRISENMILHTRLFQDRIRVHVWTNKISSDKKAIIVKNCSSAYLINPCNNEEKEITVIPFKDSCIIPLHFDEKNNYIVDLYFSKESNNIFEYESVLTKTIENVMIELKEKNSLTLDYAKVSFDEHNYSEKKPVIHLIDLIYDKRKEYPSNKDMKFSLKYEFVCSECSLSNEMTMVLEDEDVQKILVNGEEIKGSKIGWWIDRCLSEYDISNYVVQGTNAIELFYNISATNTDISITEGFETERNRFFYPVEPEAIYIRGNFDIKPTGKMYDCIRYQTFENDDFVIEKATSKTLGNLTTQGLCFYRGDVDYKFNIENVKGFNNVVLSLDSFNGFAAKWQIGEHGGYIINKPYNIDITEYLNDGNNEVCITILGTNRNLLGPHHHVNGKNTFVGPDTYAGKKGFEDFVSLTPLGDITWTSDYSFIPFGCNKILINYYK